MENDFSLSIIMPAYNVGPYIAEAVDSVLSQTLLPDELIIVNDGSTDETREVVSRYESHPIVCVIDKVNGGLGPARNTGVEHSKSKYIYFFDSDDLLDERFVESMHEICLANSAPDLIMFSGKSFRDDSSQDSSFQPPQYSRRLNASFESGMDLYRALLNSNGFFSSACLYITRKALWDDNGLKFKPVLHEDEDIIFPLLFLARKAVSTSEPFFFRRVRPGSIMTTPPSKENIHGIVVAAKTMLDLKARAGESIYEFYDLWLIRVRDLTLAYYRRLLNAGLLFPGPLMFWLVFRFGGLRTFFRVLNIYRRFFLKKTFTRNS